MYENENHKFHFLIQILSREFLNNRVVILQSDDSFVAYSLKLHFVPKRQFPSKMAYIMTGASLVLIYMSCILLPFDVVYTYFLNLFIRKLNLILREPCFSDLRLQPPPDARPKRGYVNSIEIKTN